MKGWWVGRFFGTTPHAKPDHSGESDGGWERKTRSVR